MANVCPGTAAVTNNPTPNADVNQTPNAPGDIFSSNGGPNPIVSWPIADEFCSLQYEFTPGNEFIVPETSWTLEWINQNATTGDDATGNPAIAAGFGVAPLSGTPVTGPATSGPIVIGSNTVTFTIVSGTVRVSEGNGALFAYHPGDPVSNAIIKVEWATPVHGLQHIYQSSGADQTPTGVKNYQTSLAVPPPATSAVGNPATNITQTTADTNGTITDPVAGGFWEIHLGPSGGPYTTVLCPNTPNSGANPENVTCPVTGLTPNTQYCYVVVAKDAAQVVVSTSPTEVCFTTAAVPPPVRTAQCDPATAITFNSATLNGTVGNIQPGDQFQIRYGTASGGPYGTTLGPSPAANGPVSQNAIALSPSTNYYYVVDVLDSGNAIVATSSQCTFVTAAAPLVPNAAGTPATVVTPTTANGNGTITNPPAGGFWEIHVGPSGGPYTTVFCPNTPVSGANPENVSCPLTGLTPSTQYCYVVVLKDSAQTVVSTSTPEVCFTTPALPPPPVQVTTNPPGPATISCVTLNGTSTDAPPGCTYSFVYGNTPGGPYPNTVGGTPGLSTGATPEAFTAQVCGLAQNEQIYYKAQVVCGLNPPVQGQEVPTQTTSIVLDPCVAATNITPVSATINGSSQNVPLGYTYEIRYGVAPGGPYPFSVSGGPSSGGSPDPFSANVVGLTPGTSYFYTTVTLNPAQQVVASGGECFFQTIGAVGPGGFVYWCGHLVDSAQCEFIPGVDGGYWNCNLV